jgi:hypothetical protein
MQQRTLLSAAAASATAVVPGAGGQVSSSSSRLLSMINNSSNSSRSMADFIPSCSSHEIKAIVSLPRAWLLSLQMNQLMYPGDVVVIGEADHVSALACVSTLSYLTVLLGSLLGLWMALLYEAASRRAFVAASQSLAAAAAAVTAEKGSPTSLMLSPKCKSVSSLLGKDGARDVAKLHGKTLGSSVRETSLNEVKEQLTPSIELMDFQDFVKKALQFDAQVADVLRIWHSFMLLLLILAAFLWLAPWGLAQSNT